MFCPKCGSMLIPKQGKVECSCGYKKDEAGDFKIKQELEEKEEVQLIDKEVEIRPLDKDAECPECGHKGALYRTQQTRASDEPETKFYECEKCHHRWRDYS